MSEFAPTLLSFRWKDTACVLAIHVDRGFSLTEKATQKELWSQPYANLCSSNDDGAKLLWLQFRGRQEEDEFVLQQTNPKVWNDGSAYFHFDDIDW